jgi:hypothetical protein
MIFSNIIPTIELLVKQGKHSTRTHWVSLCLSFFMSASIAVKRIFNAPTCTTSIITLEPYALNSEFQHFIPRFNKISLLCVYHWKRGQGLKAGPKRGWRQGDFIDNNVGEGMKDPEGSSHFHPNHFLSNKGFQFHSKRCTPSQSYVGLQLWGWLPLDSNCF